MITTYYPLPNLTHYSLVLLFYTPENIRKATPGCNGLIEYELGKIGRNAVRNNVLDWWTFYIWIWEVYACVSLLVPCILHFTFSEFNLIINGCDWPMNLSKIVCSNDTSPKTSRKRSISPRAQSLIMHIKEVFHLLPNPPSPTRKKYSTSCPIPHHPHKTMLTFSSHSDKSKICT